MEDVAGTFIGTTDPSDSLARMVVLVEVSGVGMSLLLLQSMDTAWEGSRGSADRALPLPLSFFGLEALRSGPGPGLDSTSPSMVRSRDHVVLL